MRDTTRSFFTALLTFVFFKSALLFGEALWKPMEHSYDIVQGSALDFSFLQEAPAGKDGFVIATNGHFFFEGAPEKRVRFYGNHVGLEGITKPECEKLAERFARMGYNAARIHVYDQDLQGKKGSSLLVDPVQEDVLDFLIDAMKRRGIYLTIDLYVARVILPGEIAGIDQAFQHAYKLLVHIHEPAFENWKRFAERVLMHTNRYTGLPLGKDPALYGISLLNEDTPYLQMRNFGRVADFYQKAFAEWKKTNPAQGLGPDEHFRFFVTETYRKSYARLASHLRSLGVRQPLTGVNYMEHQIQTFIRADLDYVDEHYYFDHPRPTAPDPKAPVQFHGKANESLDADNPRYAFSTRVFGKPFTLSEWNVVYPNPYRASSGPLMASYASLQDWDGLLRFKYTSNPYSMDKGVNVPHSYTGEVFAICDDPINLLSDKIGMLLFRRNELAAAKTAVPYGVTSEAFLPGKDARGYFPEPYTRLGLVVRTGSVLVNEKNPAPKIFVSDRTEKVLDSKGSLVLAAWQNLFDECRRRGILGASLADPDKGFFQSETGEISLDSRKTRFSAQSPWTEVFSVDGAGTAKGKFVSVENRSGFSLVAVTAMSPGKSLADSKRLLLFFLSDVRASGLSTDDAPIREYVGHGSLPHLVRVARAEITLAASGFSECSVSPLRMNGERAGVSILKARMHGQAVRMQDRAATAGSDQVSEANDQASGDRFVLPVSTDFSEGGSLVYEIVRK